MVKRKNMVYNTNYYEVIDRFLIGLFITYIFFTVVTYLEFKITYDTYFYITSLILIIFGHLIKKQKSISLPFYKKLAFLFLLYLVLLNTYMSIRYNNSFKIDYFCFSLMTSLPIVFDFKHEKIKIISLLAIIITAIVIMNTLNVPQLTIHELKSNELSIRLLKYYNIFCSLIFLSFNLIFLYEKDIYLEQQKKEIRKIETNIDSFDDSLSIEKVEELLETAKSNMILFIEQMEQIYPEISTQLCHYDFATKDLYVIYLMKLGLDTKEISVISNSTPKSIEGRKYRIKKKIKSDKSNLFISYKKTN